MKKEEINRIDDLLPKVNDIENEEDINEITEAGFKDITDFRFIKAINKGLDTFLTNVQDWEGLDERKPIITKTIIAIHVLRKQGTNV